DFFELLSSFPEYVEFFLLDDLWDSQTSQITFLHRFDDFSTPAVPKTPGDLIDYLQANNEFIEARNRRIARSLELYLLHAAFNLHDEEHVRQHTDNGDCGHVDERRGEVDVGDEEADDDRCCNRREVADEVEHSSGQTKQSLGCQRRHQRPGDRGEAIAEARDRHEHDDPR